MKPTALKQRLLGVFWFLATIGASSLLCADEFRGLWADAWGHGFLNPRDAQQLVDHCRQYNFNAVIVQMRRRGDAFYMPHSPNSEPRTTELSPDYDALQTLIDLCHNGKPRIEVHCWVTTFLVWSGHNRPPQRDHVFNTHPEYLTQNPNGEKFIGEGSYLDPGHPEATRWIYNMAKDVVSHYDIDGFHWDYIRYPSPEAGFNPTAVARFNQEFGLSGKPASSNPQFSEWRRRQVTDFLRWCNADLLEMKPELIISCSVFGSRFDAFNARFQDWARWNNEGIIDLCMPMDYTPDRNLFKSRLDDAAANQGCRWVCQGQGAYLCDKQTTLEELSAVRSRGLHGYVLYSYRASNNASRENAETLALLKSKLQSEWAYPPIPPWKETPTHALLKGIVTREDTHEPVYNAAVTLRGEVVRTQKTEAHGGYAFFETPPGAYQLSVSAPDVGNLTTNITIQAGITNFNLQISTNDTTAPALSDLVTERVTDTSAVITWKTDERTDSVIELRTGNSPLIVITNSSKVVSHDIEASDLTPNSVYHVRVRSKDSSGNQTTSRSFNFKTLPAGEMPEIIIDNAQANVAGAWVQTAYAPDKYGPDYRFKSSGDGSSHVEFVPKILKSGKYKVFEWHSAGVNRCSVTPHVIHFDGGTKTITVNQQADGGRWNLLGTFAFAAGTTGTVRINDRGENGKVSIADAIRFVYVKPSADEIVEEKGKSRAAK